MPERGVRLPADGPWGDERLMELSLSFQKVEHISSVSNYNRLTLEDT